MASELDRTYPILRGFERIIAEAGQERYPVLIPPTKNRAILRLIKQKYEEHYGKR